MISGTLFVYRPVLKAKDAAAQTYPEMISLLEFIIRIAGNRKLLITFPPVSIDIVACVATGRRYIFIIYDN